MNNILAANKIKDICRFVGLVFDHLHLQTHLHSTNVGMLCESFSIYLGHAPERTLALYCAGLAHDIGKLLIIDTIININGKRLAKDSPEWRQIRLHPFYGARLISLSRSIFYDASKDFMNIILKSILDHHVWYNGDARGYPNNRPIPPDENAGVVQIADVYHSITDVNRDYNRVFTKSQALDELQRCAGTQLNPYLVDHFISMLHKA